MNFPRTGRARVIGGSSGGPAPGTAFALRVSGFKEGPSVARPLDNDDPLALALAVVGLSSVPLLMMDEDLTLIAASDTFWEAFDLPPGRGIGRHLSQLGSGEWNAPRLRSLLAATAAGDAEISAYEMDFQGKRQGLRRLVLRARRLDYGEGRPVRLLLAIADVTGERAELKLKDDLLRQKAILLQELQHRVANSLQVIASVILQSARKTKNDETRLYLADAHSRVMSVASLQDQLARSSLDAVELRAYFTKLCASLAASMIHDPEQISIAIESDEHLCAPDTSISLGLIITELVINSLKHAFPGERPGKIVVGYRCNGPNWTLSVEDDGVGMPDDPASATPGLGTSIVEALARQLEARVQVENAHPGTRVSIIRTRIAAVDADEEEDEGGRAAGSAA